MVAKELNKLDLCANMYILFKSPKFACLCDGDDAGGDGDDAVGDGDDAGGAGDKQWWWARGGDGGSEIRRCLLARSNLGAHISAAAAVLH